MKRRFLAVPWKPSATTAKASPQTAPITQALDKKGQRQLAPQPACLDVKPIPSFAPSVGTLNQPIVLSPV